MKKIFFYIIVSFILVSCNRSQNNIPIFLHALSKKNIEKFTLKSIQREGFISFNYLQKKDTIKNIDLKYMKEKDIIITNLDTFITTKKHYKSKTLSYTIYKHKLHKSHNRFLVFNKNYGLFANLASGANFLFLRDTISSYTKGVIFKELFLQVHKINVE